MERPSLLNARPVLHAIIISVGERADLISLSFCVLNNRYEKKVLALTKKKYQFL